MTSKNQVLIESGSDQLSNFSVALVEPEFPLNVGYLARTMANFGLNQLYIVSEKRESIEQSEAIKFSSHGHYILEKTKYVKALDEMRRKFRILVGTTAIRGKRKSNITRKTLELENSIPKILNAYRRSKLYRLGETRGKNDKGICFVFGRDTTGLTNEELRLCDYNITIMTGTAYNTLNISHAAAILFYSFRNYLKRHSAPPKEKISSEMEPTRKEKARLLLLFKKLAISSDFQSFKRAKLEETLSRILNRSNPSLREIYLLMGLVSKAQAKIKNLSAQER